MTVNYLISDGPSMGGRTPPSQEMAEEAGARPGKDQRLENLLETRKEQATIQ